MFSCILTVPALIHTKACSAPFRRHGASDHLFVEIVRVTTTGFEGIERVTQERSSPNQYHRKDQHSFEDPLPCAACFVVSAHRVTTNVFNTISHVSSERMHQSVATLAMEFSTLPLVFSTSTNLFNQTIENGIR
jgi:hypothetical protein